MPGVEDWMNCPLNIIQNLFDQNGQNVTPTQVKEYFSKKLTGRESLAWIPSLNDIPVHNLRPNTIVKYRCMIQDMFDPELYLGVYEVNDVQTGQKSLKCGKYKDIAECTPQQIVNMESSENKPMDRQTFYCVPIPGEADWVKLAYANQNVSDHGASSSQSRLKRPLEDDQEKRGEKHSNNQNGDVNMEAESLQQNNCPNQANGSNGTGVRSGTNCKPDLNHPLPGETGLTCLVKIYDDVDTFKVNDVVEFIGILSVDPAMAQFPDSQEGEEFETPEERQAHSPPPSLVPRLHVVLYNKLNHDNPLLPPLKTDSAYTEALSSLQSNIVNLRNELISVLEYSLLGDNLAAEYLLSHLISYVYGRADVMPLGKLSLNLSNCPNSRYYGGLMHRLISAILTKSHLLPMTIENMNTMKLIPKKDIKANRLESGILQLSDNTQLLIDETLLQTGQLNPQGVRNVTALGNLITWQKVEYDFNFHSQPFSTNVNVLILSEVKSLLPSDVQVPLNKKLTTDNIQEHFEQLDSRLTTEFLNKLRTYITLTHTMDYSVSEDLQKIIQDDFVDSRKDNPKAMTIDDFHALLNLLRLQTLSHCQPNPTPEMWNKVKTMERERRERLTQAAPTS
ncbi:mini-chromosome maintenance complex-binding protein [Patella vulgata]|uniref:mini-chromosome maintenance complex-binding protein n=1 Tax=Patella vulgata TaxID=6465 RepID=UPI0021800ECE|nr:mini-chromosome maintenance complex-binding protein [Patella vulgata]XP_055955972.1 mini-chromosome maintenance complex-binding protein [Patella vulgata]